MIFPNIQLIEEKPLEIFQLEQKQENKINLILFIEFIFLIFFVILNYFMLSSIELTAILLIFYEI